ncbi:MAG: hypothetical protein M0R17_03065 [Candidatus Omnitrophica bacterium]|nr:hypothetical protein [Candidatus Omnitrophota bacterium]
MYICTSCLKEMQCVHTGTKVRYSFDGSHVYAGDTFECPKCGSKIVATNRTAYHDDKVVISSTDILMDPIETEVSRPKNIQLRDSYIELSENQKAMNWLEKEQEKTMLRLNTITARKYTDFGPG